MSTKPAASLELPPLSPPPLESDHKVGDRVFCFFKGLPYEASILEVSNQQTTPASSEQADSLSATKNTAPHLLTKETTTTTTSNYLIHYIGWKKRWDERVSAERLIPLTEESKAEAEALQQEHREATLLQAEGKQLAGKLRRRKKKASKKKTVFSANKGKLTGTNKSTTTTTATLPPSALKAKVEAKVEAEAALHDEATNAATTSNLLPLVKPSKQSLITSGMFELLIDKDHF